MIDQPERLNFLGIDWGKRNIGIALAHGETRIAIPLLTERNDTGVFERLGKLIIDERIATVIIGIPSYINRPETEHPGEAFGRKLREKFGVQIAYQDEMFTTKLAQQQLIQRGEKHVGQRDDAEAACIILQQWLDQSDPTDGELSEQHTQAQ